MSRSGSSSSKQQTSRTESSLGKKKSCLSQSILQSKTKKHVTSKKTQPVSKQPMHSDHLQQSGKQDHSTDLDLERPFVFTEIWPSSEPSPPRDTPSFDQNVKKVSEIDPFELDMSHSPVLARYVDRFRHGRPQSREERQQTTSQEEESQLPFWWASSSSMPPDLAPDKSNEETEILHLQEEASKLLQKGDVCLEEDSLRVSSDGVGCSDFSSPISADEPVRRPTTSSVFQGNIAKVLPPVIPLLVTPTRPEEDILFQWRLRRKMEKAREWTQAQQHFNLQDLHLAHPLMNTQSTHPSGLPQETKGRPIREPNLPNPQIPANTTETQRRTSADGNSCSAVGHVPSHMHLLCDILPCPIQLSHPGEQTLSQALDSLATSLPERMNRVTKHKTPLTTLESTKKDLHLSQTKSTEAFTEQPEKHENKSVYSKQDKKTPRVLKKENIFQKQKQENTEVDKQSRGGRESPPSPIHSTLGQVVSEVLFPIKSSIRAQGFSPTTSFCSTSTSQQSISHKSEEVILHNLQEAEDSDETEFKDDPLLQVLRKQRRRVKEQIKEVDMLLKKFPEQHRI